MLIKPQNDVLFVIGKSREIPGNGDKWSIPRKELIATVTGANLVTLAKHALMCPIDKVYIWIDSTMALMWITNGIL